MLYVTNLSTLKTHHLCCCLYQRRRPSHNFLFLSNQTCYLDTFVTKASFYHFFLHQTQSKCDVNVFSFIIYPKSGFGPAGVSVDSGGGPCGGGLAASYT